MNDIVKGLILLIISVGGGTFVNRIMENITINVWIARAGGCLVSVVFALVIFKFFFKSRKE